MHIIYYHDVKRNDFSFYTNINVNEYNAMELAEISRKRWRIENGYLKKKNTKEKIDYSSMDIKYFLFFLLVLLCNM